MPPLDEHPSPPPPPADASTIPGRQARRESSARSYPRRIPLTLVRGSGSTVWDDRGDAYLERVRAAQAEVRRQLRS